MKILITGANGMLAKEVKEKFSEGNELILTDVAELDITNEKAVLDFVKNLKPDYIITDAMPLDGFTDIPHEKIIKGDAKSISIAAASVIAKVTRDRLMYEEDKKHPEYEFAKHKGYPTKKHIELLNKYGIIDGYRRTYGPVKKYIEEHK